MSVSPKSNGQPCPSCLKTINWVFVEIFKERELLKAPIFPVAPNPPSECNVYPNGAGPYLVSDPDWNKDKVLANYNHEFIEDYVIGISRSCAGQATNVQLLDTKTVTREELLGPTAPSVDFYWQCSTLNPNPPPSEILTVSGPVSKTFDRDQVIEYQDVYYFYQGQIVCTCGEPADCGC